MKILYTTIKLTAISILVLGLIHCLATPIIMKSIPKDIYWVFFYMFILTGVALIFFGFVMLVELNRIKTEQVKTLFIINITLSICLLSGILAAIIMPQNPFAIIFATVSGLGSVLVFLAQRNRSVSHK